jgi:hypothetical protein
MKQPVGRALLLGLGRTLVEHHGHLPHLSLASSPLERNTAKTCDREDGGGMVFPSSRLFSPTSWSLAESMARVAFSLAFSGESTSTTVELRS